MDSQDQLSLSEFFDRIYRPLKLSGRSAGHSKQFGVQFRHFARHLGREPVLSDLTEESVTTFLAAFSDGRSGATVNKARAHLVALWHCAARRGYLKDWPVVAKATEPAYVPRAWLVDEIVAILTSCRLETGTIDGVAAGDWWESIHRFWFDGGERTAATLAVRWEWVDLRRGLVVVEPSVRKGGAKELVYPILPSTVESLKKIRRPHRDLVWPWPWCIGTFYHRYKRIIERADLPTGRKHGPQKMRRSFASHYAAAGGDATKALHHSSRAVTERSYLDPTITGQATDLSKMPPLDMTA